MKITKQIFKGKDESIPAAVFEPEIQPHGYVLVVHGYGGCKEEQLGLAWRIAQKGFTSVAIDLRGHGENENFFDENIFEGVRIAVEQLKELGKVVAIGHSLGGRLSLISQADFKIGISPVLSKTYSPKTVSLIKEIRGHRTREIRQGILFETLHELPLWNEKCKSQSMFLYASQDVPEIMADCSRLKEEGNLVMQIDNSRHADIFLNELTFLQIEKQLKDWFCLN